MTKRLFAAAAFLFLSSPAFASTCMPGTLQDYVDLSFPGCQIGDRLFRNFGLGELQSGATEIDPQTVQVTPVGGLSRATFRFTLNRSAAAGELLESAFFFEAYGGLLGASISLQNPLAAGDGAVTGILDVCAGDFFLGVEPVGCLGTAGTAIAFATDFDSSLKESVTFAPTGFFDVFVDLAIDGGLGGFASLDSAEVSIATPEPSTTLLFAAGFFTLSIARLRARGRS